MHQDCATMLGWCCGMAGDKLTGKKSHCVVFFKSEPHTHNNATDAGGEGCLGDLLSSLLLEVGFCWFLFSSRALKTPGEGDVTLSPCSKAAPCSSREVFPCLSAGCSFPPQLRFSAVINEHRSTKANFTPAEALIPGTQPPIPPLPAEFIPSIDCRVRAC